MNTESLDRLTAAVDLAAQAHRTQRRKDLKVTPYVNHPIRVMRLLAEAGYSHVTDLLVAAVCHDLLEDTLVTYADLVRLFDYGVANLVQELTDDKTLPWEERKRLQLSNAPRLSWRASLIRIADKAANVYDVLHYPPMDWDDARRGRYVDWATDVVNACKNEQTAGIVALFEKAKGFDHAVR